MNTINIAIDFTNKTNRVSGISLVTGDYASTKIVFSFDREDGRKVFELKNPSGETRYVGNIVNNEVVLTGIDNGHNYSIFNEAGLYVYEVSLYVGDSKLTSAFGTIPVKQEQVIVGDEVIEPYLPIFDELMQEINTAITETNNLDLDAEKVNTTTTITLTKKDGTTKTIEILDGEKGDKGDKGDAGAVKAIPVQTLPTEDIDDSAIYLVPMPKIEVETLPETGTPNTIYIVTSTQKRYIYSSNQWIEISQDNNYLEYMYINNKWELLGALSMQIDLSNYVKNTDYATTSKGGVIKTGGLYGTGVTNGILMGTIKTYEQYQSSSNLSDYGFISKGTLENVITGKGLTTKSYVDGLVGDIQTLLDNLDTGAGV